MKMSWECVGRYVCACCYRWDGYQYRYCHSDLFLYSPIYNDYVCDECCYWQIEYEINNRGFMYKLPRLNFNKYTHDSIQSLRLLSFVALTSKSLEQLQINITRTIHTTSLLI